MGKVEIKYKYEDCSSTFLQRQHLYRQKLKYHKKVAFSCKNCPKLYSRHDALKHHKCSNQTQIEDHCTVC